MSEFDTLVIEIKKAKQNGATWRDVGRTFGITGGLAHRIANEGHEPKEPDIRRRLGLPVLLPAPACPDCGAVHTIPGVCVAKSMVKIQVIQVTPEELATIEHPVVVTVKQSVGIKRQRARASINLEDAGSAARTIRRKMDAETLAALLDLLKEDIE